MSITIQEMFQSEISRYGMALYPIACKNDLDLTGYNVAMNEDTIAITLPTITPEQFINANKEMPFIWFYIDGMPVYIDGMDIIHRENGHIVYDAKNRVDMINWLSRFTIKAKYI